MKTRLLGIYITIVTLLLPLKFGSLAALSDVAGFFPEDPLSYLIISWPAHALGWFGAIGLLWCSLVLPMPNWRSPAVRSGLALGLLLPLVALTAWGRGDVEVALGEISHLWGMGSWILSVAWLLSAMPLWRFPIFNAVAVAVLWLGILSFRQYFFGFAEMQNFVAQQQQQGIEVNRSLLYKLADTRVYATMVSCNALAGYLLLTLPVAMWQISRWAQRFEPVKVSRWLFLGVGGVLGVGALILTRARGALLAVLITLALMAFSAKISKKWKLAGAIMLILAISGGAFFAYRYGRGFGSMAERGDYLRSSGLMIKAKPWIGHGWGEFFYFHMREKITSTDESARDPHNIVASFATATGIWGGVLAFFALLYPLIKLWKNRFNGEHAPVFWSGVAFGLHTLMDSDLQIPALLATYGVLMSGSLAQETSSEKNSYYHRFLLFIGVIIICTMAVVSNYWWLRGEYAQAQLWSQLMPSTPAERELSGKRSTEEVYLQAISFRPYSTSCREFFGDYHFKNNNLLEAQKYYREAVKINPRRPGIWRRLAEIELRIGSQEKAKEYMIKANKLFPRNPKYFLSQ